MARIRSLLACALAAVSLAACAGVPLDPAADPSADARETAPRRGPIRERSNGPLSQTFATIRPRGAATTAPGSVDLTVLSTYSSIFEVGAGQAGSVNFDGEIWRTSAMVRTGVTERTDVEVEIPLVYATSGFLDVFIESWHDVFGLPDSGRETRPHFDYDMHVSANGQEAYHLEGNELGFGDVPITITQRIVDARGSAPAVFVQGAVEIPTGSESRGFGNGAFEWALGVGLESTLGDWSVGGGVGWSDRERPSSFAATGLEVQDGIHAQGDVEWRWLPTSSLLLGLRFENAVSADLGIEELGGHVLDLDFGVAVDGAGRSRWTAGFVEDLISASGPDFTVVLGFQTTF